MVQLGQAQGGTGAHWKLGLLTWHQWCHRYHPTPTGKMQFKGNGKTGRLDGLQVVSRLDFGSDHDLKSLGSNPALGSVLSGEPACPSAPPPTHVGAVSFSQIYK